MQELEADFVVVGSGAGGSVVAGRLAEDPATRVIVIEAGGADSGLIYRVPGIGFMASFETRSNWGFRTLPIPALNGRELVFLQGRIAGGSSSINGMVYARGHAANYDQWRDMGCTGWGHDDVLPFFRKLEASRLGTPQERGRDGPVALTVSEGRSARIPGMLAEAFSAAGVPVLADLNQSVPEGVGLHEANIRNGRRVSAATAYLRPAQRRGNLRLLTDTLALRVVFEADRAAGVEVCRNGCTFVIRARREVILAGGAIKTPQLLMLSGIGPAGELQDHGIAVRHAAPQVGRNLQNHPSLRLEYGIALPVTNYRYARPWHAAAAGLDYLLRRRGLLAETFVPFGGFIRSRPDLPRADVQFVVAAALIPKLPPGRHGLRAYVPQRDGFTITLYQGTPHSRGAIRLASADPGDQPLIDAGYLSDPRDMTVIADATTRLRGILQNAPFGRHLTELAPGGAEERDEALRERIAGALGTSYHQSGTCAMGPDPGAVVDLQLRVRGVRGLRIADASVIPLLPTAALHGPVMMIAERAAHFIRNGSQP